MQVLDLTSLQVLWSSLIAAVHAHLALSWPALWGEFRERSAWGRPLSPLATDRTALRYVYATLACLQVCEWPLLLLTTTTTRTSPPEILLYLCRHRSPTLLVPEAASLVEPPACPRCCWPAVSTPPTFCIPSWPAAPDRRLCPPPGARYFPASSNHFTCSLPWSPSPVIQRRPLGSQVFLLHFCLVALFCSNSCRSLLST